MGDFDLSRQGQLQSRIPITAFFICIREKRKKLSFYLCPGDKRLSTSDVSFVNDSFILNESLQGLESNESSQKKIRSFSRGHASGLA